MKHCDDAKIEVWDLNSRNKNLVDKKRAEWIMWAFVATGWEPSNLRTMWNLPSLWEWEDPPPADETSADCSSTWFMLWQHHVTSSQTCSGARKHIYILLIRTYRLHVWNRHDYILSNEILCRAGWKMLVYLVNRPDMELQTWFTLSVEL